MDHEKYGFTKVSNTLNEAIEAMILHLEYEEPDLNSEKTGGFIWKRTDEGKFPTTARIRMTY